MPVDVWKTVVSVAHDPLLAVFLGAVIVLALLLGALHELEIVGDVLLVLIRKVKRLLYGLRRIGRELWQELTTWKTEE
jgi:hypothetical protein